MRLAPVAVATDSGVGADATVNRHPRCRAGIRLALTATVLVLAGVGACEHRSDILRAGGMLPQLRIAWLVVGIGAELASMVVFARLQRRLLGTGGVRVALVPMFEITLAGNALSRSLPGGPALSATWAFKQMRRRGAEKSLAAWVVLVAGALSSFAVFVILTAGCFIAGDDGPVAQLRWVVAALAAVPVLIIAVYAAAQGSEALSAVFCATWEHLVGRSQIAQVLVRRARRGFVSLRMVRPRALGWAEAFALAMANWLYDGLCLVAGMEALGLPVPWRGILVVYGLTQVAASIPITPGGIGVVEASMTALLVAYRVRTASALSTVLLYRVVSFWGLVPLGWVAWLGLELAVRRRLRRSAHASAVHKHGPQPVADRTSTSPFSALARSTR